MIKLKCFWRRNLNHNENRNLNLLFRKFPHERNCGMWEKCLWNNAAKLLWNSWKILPCHKAMASNISLLCFNVILAELSEIKRPNFDDVPLLINVQPVSIEMKLSHMKITTMFRFLLAIVESSMSVNRMPSKSELFSGYGLQIYCQPSFTKSEVSTTKIPIKKLAGISSERNY